MKPAFVAACLCLAALVPTTAAAQAAQDADALPAWEQLTPAQREAQAQVSVSTRNAWKHPVHVWSGRVAQTTLLPNSPPYRIVTSHPRSQRHWPGRT